MEQRQTLRELRHLAGQTLERSAEWLGVSTSQLHYIETGRATLSAAGDAALRTFYLARIAERHQRAVNLIERGGTGTPEERPE